MTERTKTILGWLIPITLFFIGLYFFLTREPSSEPPPPTSGIFDKVLKN